MADSKHVVKFKAAHLKPGESVLAWGEGYIGKMMGKGKDQQHNGALIVTGERVAFYRKGLFGQVIESIPLKSITSIERKSFMGHCSIRLHASHDELEFKTFQKDVEQALVTAIESGRSASAASAVVSQPSAENPADTLKRLGELKDSGLISDEEFAAKKAEILARL